MRAPWWQDRLCVFDLESTGVDVFRDHIVTATVAYVCGSRPTSTLSWLVNPGVPIPAEVAKIHGITNEKAEAEGKPPELALPGVALALAIAIGEGWPVVAFNANYDLSLLISELRRRQLESDLEVRLAGAHVVDPLVIDRGMVKYHKGSRKLGDVCKRYGVTLENAHDSTADALAAGRLAYKMAAKYPELGDLAELQRLQAEWHSVWATNFAHYLRNQGKTADDVDPAGWPLRRQKLQEVSPCK